MRQRHQWPSRWWFWPVPVLANLHLLAILILLIGPFGSSVGGVLDVMYMPFEALSELFEPQSGIWSVEQAALIALGMWELAAVVVGLLCYGGALLAHAIVPDEGGEGKHGDGSQ